MRLHALGQRVLRFFASLSGSCFDLVDFLAWSFFFLFLRCFSSGAGWFSGFRSAQPLHLLQGHRLLAPLKQMNQKKMYLRCLRGTVISCSKEFSSCIYTNKSQMKRIFESGTRPSLCFFFSTAYYKMKYEHYSLPLRSRSFC